MNHVATADSVTTSVVDPHERADYWAHAINTYQCRLGYRFPSRTDFQGHSQVRRTDSYQLIGWESDAITYLRTSKLIRADPDDNYRLIIPFTGQLSFGSDDGHGILTPASLLMVAIDQPFALSMSEVTRGVIITIPRDEVRHRLNRVAPPAGPIDLTTGLGRVSAAMIDGLYTEYAALTDREFDSVSERLVDLLCMQILGDTASTPGSLADVEAAARRYIRAHAGDADLTGARVAAALGWSLRQIQLAFNAVGATPSEVIREERLHLACERLSSPAYQRCSIADIASDLGFGSASSFNKAFRRRFDATPSQFRGGVVRDIGARLPGVGQCAVVQDGGEAPAVGL
ncbi:AraC family transcriptional regulator [Nocardia sp. NPDC058058]|uniref:AraC family transcriptional regulator n=1 Tax=Nocardia sp. NPDC058058 TaxID=3346317 RepID=UPI0036D7CED9